MTPLGADFEHSYQMLAGSLAAAKEKDELLAVLSRHFGIGVALWLRLLNVSATGTSTLNTEFLTVDETSEFLKLPKRRVRSLARGADWAPRIGQTIRIDRARLIVAIRSGRLGLHVPADVRQRHALVPGEHESRRKHAR